MPAVSIPRAPVGLRSKRLLALAGDDRIVDAIRAGSEAAFEVAFERHGPPILGFCRHMLGSPQEAEDAVQHTFAAAYRALLDDERDIRLRPWLFAIARNRCLTILRTRREQVAELHDVPTEDLGDEVQRRSELRELLTDVRDLPDEQRAALLLAELGGLSHADVAEVIGCEVQRVKALVFRARSGLIERRDARSAPCHDIREQLANLRGGSLRRSELRHHLRVCDGCREYREQVRRQRQMLGLALPVTPSIGLKSSVMSALGIGGGSAGGGGALAGATAAVGPLASTAAKVACVAVVAGGGAVAGEAVLSQPDAVRGTAAPALEAPATPASGTAEAAAPGAAGSGAEGHAQRRAAAERRKSARKRSQRGNRGADAGKGRAQRNGGPSAGARDRAHARRNAARGTPGRPGGAGKPVGSAPMRQAQPIAPRARAQGVDRPATRTARPGRAKLPAPAVDALPAGE